jgi:hypothetical protein
VLVILNEPGFGGCGGGGFQIVTLGSSWAVMAHEFGHGTGGLADEYCRNRKHTGSEPGAVDLTRNTNRNTLKWRRFVNPSTPIPTGIKPAMSTTCTDYNQGTRPAGWSSSQDVGLFEGGGTYNEDIYRPVENCRMRGNSPPFCPVCYTEMKTKHHSITGRNFLKCYAGDFNGDGKDDLLVHNSNGIMLYRSNGSQLDVVFSVVDRVPGSWQFTDGDQFYIGDFNGDGKDEVVIYNSKNWSSDYLGLLADDGHDGLRLIWRRNVSIPGWQFNKDDKFFVADFNGDQRDDLYVFNGDDWSMSYLEMLRSTGNDMAAVRRFDGTLPGWDEMRRHDQWFVADVNGDQLDDLYVYNAEDWVTEYLGTFRSTASNLTGGWQDDWIGSWNLGRRDRFRVANFNGGAGWEDLLPFNDEWFGLLRSHAGSSTLSAIYPNWIHNHNFHNLGWW